MPLITFTPKGLYCEKADVYIDPWRKVNKALITHAHADHARKGHEAYLSHHHGVEILKLRLGKINIQGIEYGHTLDINGVTISFHPAGHVVGSAMIKLEDKYESWVISGDYKLAEDNLSAPWEPVICDHFVTESTFGLPVYQWEDPEIIFEDINQWWQQNREQGRPSVMTAYSLGKAQRIIKNVNSEIGPIIAHHTIEKINTRVRAEGLTLPPTLALPDASAEDISTALILCPSRSLETKWAAPIIKPLIGVASGWMALRGTRKRRQMDKGFVLSDHADWPALNQAVELSEAENIYVTHGYEGIYSKYLNGEGYKAQAVKTLFEGEKLEEPVSS